MSSCHFPVSGGFGSDGFRLGDELLSSSSSSPFSPGSGRIFGRGERFDGGGREVSFPCRLRSLRRRFATLSPPLLLRPGL
jgi:hypothetical protein